MLILSRFAFKKTPRPWYRQSPICGDTCLFVMCLFSGLMSARFLWRWGRFCGMWTRKISLPRRPDAGWDWWGHLLHSAVTVDTYKQNDVMLVWRPWFEIVWLVKNRKWVWSVQENRNVALENLKKREKKNPTKKQTVSAQKVQNTSLVPFIVSTCNGLQLHYFF